MRRTVGLVALMVGLLSAAPAFATAYVIQLSGMCSKDWSGSAGATPGQANSDAPQGSSKALASNWANVINAWVDQQQSSLSTASSQLTGYLNSYCSGANSCWIYTYSAGDLVLGYTLAHSPAYHITKIVTSAGAAGGSNLANSVLANIAACGFSSNLTESYARGSYTHDLGYNTGTTNYRLGGNKHFLSGASCVVGTAINFLTFNFKSTCLQSHNDGAVAYHSSGGWQSAGDNQYFWRSTDSSGSHWYSNASFWVTSPSPYDGGDNLNHFNMKAYGVCMDNGYSNLTYNGSALSGWSQCLAWSQTQ